MAVEGEAQAGPQEAVNLPVVKAVEEAAAGPQGVVNLPVAAGPQEVVNLPVAAVDTEEAAAAEAKQ